MLLYETDFLFALHRITGQGKVQASRGLRMTCRDRAPSRSAVDRAIVERHRGRSLHARLPTKQVHPGARPSQITIQVQFRCRRQFANVASHGMP